MERKQELQTAIDLQTMDNPSENQATTRLPVKKKQNTCGLLLCRFQNTPPEEFKNGGFTLKTHQMFSVYNTSEEFENGGFTLTTHQMFFAYNTPEEFETGTLTSQFA